MSKEPKINEAFKRVRITKVKLTENGCEIGYDMPKGKESADSLDLVGVEAPAPSLKTALQAFSNFVVNLCDWSPSVVGKVTVQGVAIAHSERRVGDSS